jgi:cell division protease FtsH
MDLFSKKKNKKTKKKGSKKVSLGKNPEDKKGSISGTSKLPPKQQFLANLLSTVLIFFILVTAYSFIVGDKNKPEEIPISQLAQDIEEGLVSTIVVSGESLEITYIPEDMEESVEELPKEPVEETEEGIVPEEEIIVEDIVKKSKKEAGTALTETLVNYGVTHKQLNAVSIEIKNPSGFRFWFFTLAPFMIPIFLIIFIIWFLSRQVKGAGMQAFTFGQSKARIIDPNDKSQKITFKDVAGAKEAKEELIEIVDFLKNPKKFLSIGAQIPKGIMLMGAPGTGKTLLARAVAGEAGVPFFSISGSEFVEMFVGVGASRVRDLFALAKKAAPAIIFVDEIDAVGRVRGTGVGGGNDEREQTLNQILVEMDGFEQNEKVIVMAATNRPDVLDPALLRPGRFDRRVTIDLPDRGDREEILRIHARKKPLHEDIDFTVIAERTPGFSGADLSSLMNEGAILAARENRKTVTQYDLIRSIEKVMLGPERKSHLLNKKEKEITAYHEAGHALISSVLPYADPVHKISIISRGRAAGYTLKLPFEDRKMQSKKEFLDDIAMSLGGYIAEQMVFNDITTGASNDLQVLTALARNMVTKYGMSDTMGPIALEGAEGRALFGTGINGKEYSEKVSAEIDVEVHKIINEAYEKGVRILTDHRKVLDAIAQKLVEVESLEREAFEQLLIANGITPKKKEDIEHAG